MKACAFGLRVALYLLVLSLVTGLAYPLAVTGLATLLFPGRAAGSLVRIDGLVRGSTLLAQDFGPARYFLARPSATGYATLGSGGSNLAATNPALGAAVEERRAAWTARTGQSGGDIPEEILHASGSGLDPDLSPGAALAQVPAIARERGYTVAMANYLEALVRKEARLSSDLLGPERVNVVRLNTLLDTDPALAGRN